MLDTIDFAPSQRDALRRDVHAGLSRARKTLPSRWLYDAHGSALFEAITTLPEYYPTRTETEILRTYAADMAHFLGANAAILEYGAGAGLKTEILLAALSSPRIYVPIDIAGDFLKATARRLSVRFPALRVLPLVADFTATFEIPNSVPDHRRAFFPGSTIGNLDPAESDVFLRQIRRHVGPTGAALVGIDLRKDVDTMIRAYDDRAGVTAAFNLNLLGRLNRELGATFVVDNFRHEARWRETESAVEMHLISLIDQTIEVDGLAFAFEAGETIHTESSRKYELDKFQDNVGSAGWRLDCVWTDPAQRFAVCGLSAAAPTR